MSKTKIKIDESLFSSVVLCQCGWRCQRPTRAAATVAAARHLKAEHGELHAAREMRRRARKFVEKTRSQDN